MTIRATNGYVWPAHTGRGAPGAPPMGARLRLRSKDLSGYPVYIQQDLSGDADPRPLVADNGSDMYVTGTMDPRWNNDELNPAFRSLRAQDFEVYSSSPGGRMSRSERSEPGREEAAAPKAQAAGIRPSSPSEERGERAERRARGASRAKSEAST